MRRALAAAAALVVLAGCSGGAAYGSPHEIADAIGCERLVEPTDGSDWLCTVDGAELTITDWRGVPDAEAFRELSRESGATLFDVGDDFSVGGYDPAAVDAAREKLGD